MLRVPDGTTLALLAAGFAIGLYLPNKLVDQFFILLLVALTITTPLLLFYLIDRL